MEKNKKDLTTGPVWKTLLLFALPIIFSAILQDLYNVADKIVVGRFAADGKLALAAVGAVTPALAILVDFFSGLSLGINVICANYRGAKKVNELRSAMHTALVLALLCGIFVMALGIGLAWPMLDFLKTPDTIKDLSHTYMCIYFAGAPFLLVYNSGAGILLSNGDTKRPMIILTCSGLVNVALNLLLVVICGMGVEGVALGTVVAQLVSAVWVLWILFNPKEDYKLTLKELRVNKKDALALAKIALPSAINNTAFDFSNFFMQAAVNTLGDVVIAGCTAASSIGNLTYKFPAGFYSACVSVSGQCYGARKFKRIDKVAITGIILSVTGVALLASVITLFREQALAVFNSDPKVIEGGMAKLMVLSWGYVVYCIQGNISGCLHGLKRNTATTAINLIFVVGTRLPWALLIFPMKPSAPLLFLSYPLSWLLCGIAQTIFFLHVRKKLWTEASAKPAQIESL